MFFAREKLAARHHQVDTRAVNDIHRLDGAAQFALKGAAQVHVLEKIGGAQAVGLIFSITSIILIYGFGLVGAAYAVLGVLVLFAGLEAFAGFCMGCFIFGYLISYKFINLMQCD